MRVRTATSILCSACLLLGQRSAPTLAQEQNTPIIHATTRLVQLDVVVVDKHGRAVTGLSPEDFRVLDNGREQKIAHFSTPSPSVSTPRPPTSPLVITNRPYQRGERPATTTVILVDEAIMEAPFLSPEATAPIRGARLEVLKFLSALQPGEQVALYALRAEGVVVIHDFTDDTAALIVAAKTLGTGLHGTGIPFGDGAGTAAIRTMRGWLAGPSFRLQQEKDSHGEDLNRILVENAFQAIVDHLRGIPGRKNLIWISSTFPSNITDFNPGLMVDERHADILPEKDIFNPHPPQYSEPVIHYDQLRWFARWLSDANVSVYPMDALELSTLGAGAADMKSGTEPPPPMVLTEGPLLGSWATMDLIADETGGRAVYNSNGLDQHMQEVLEESSKAYELAYYPGDAGWDGKYHKIEVKMRPEGLAARCRKGYFAIDVPLAKDPEASLRAAAESALEGSGIGVTLNVLSNPLGPFVQEVAVKIDTQDLHFEQSGGRWKAQADVLFANVDKDGRVLGGAKDHVELALNPKAYRDALVKGWSHPKILWVDPDAERMRVVVRDPATGRTGSVSVSVLHDNRK
jgi:VWFA-related protein